MNTVRISTETHEDIATHITYATIRLNAHKWHSIELDRHHIGAINPDPTTEREALQYATLQHYTTAEIPGTRTSTDHDTSTEGRPTEHLQALIRVRMNEADQTIMRGQTIIAQIRADRAQRIERQRQMKSRKSGLLTDKTRSIFA